MIRIQNNNTNKVKMTQKEKSSDSKNSQQKLNDSHP
jgi:hypothetical protein